MTSSETRRCLQLQSLVKSNGELVLSLAEVEVPPPRPDEVVVRVEASPINPSDQGVLFAGADLTSATQTGTATRPQITARIPAERMKALAGRVDKPTPAGNEGAGVVVDAGNSPKAQALLGKTVAAFGGAMYSQLRCVEVAQCLPLPEGAKPSEGASAFINPLTALGMVETMQREGHKALVHTAAASNLGQMLNRICLADGIPLVNIVRSDEQARLLQSRGARHVCNSASPAFERELTDAIAATGSTIAFDAIGGGTVASQILAAMETVLIRSAQEYNRYGSGVHKQVYVYGSLDPGPTILQRNFGFAFGVDGWLLWPFMQKIGVDGVERLKRRVVAELTTTFASHYGKEISLAQALSLDEIASYTKRATAAKYLVNPNRSA